MSNYIYSQEWADEKRRLDALSALYDEGSIGHLVDLGVAHGWRCWEVGAGSGTIARWLAERVGSDGWVLATDIDTRFIDSLAGEHVEVRRLDVVNEPPDGERFDLVHARALLEHLPERGKGLNNMIRALRPDGWLLAEDVIFPAPVCDPDRPVLAKVIVAFATAFRSTGADPDYGVRLPNALLAAGLVDVQAAARVPLASSGTSTADFLLLSLEHLQGRFVAAGLLTADEVDEALRVLRTPGTTLIGPIMVAAWGRRPSLS